MDLERIRALQRKPQRISCGPDVDGEDLILREAAA
jgi:hypothetical protein